MDYQKIHDKIIFRAKMENRKKLKTNHPDYVYYEAHHILPKCIYPEYKDFKLYPWNKVLLTGREHYVIHQLLIFMYPGEKKLIKAATKMASISTTHKGRSKNELYDWLRKLAAEVQRQQETGKKRSLESIKKRTETRRKNGWNRNPELTKKRQSEARIGIEFSEEHMKNLSKALTGRKTGPCSEEKRRKISLGQIVRHVLCVELQICFRSAFDAAKYINANNASSIHHSCKTGCFSYGYHWKYV